LDGLGPLELMPRPRTGRLRVKVTSRGRSFGVRFKVGPQEHFVQLGGEWEGWTEQQARAQMQVLMRQVERGEWKPPATEKARAEPEPTFQVFASVWLDRRQRRLAPKSIAQYEWALGHLLDFFGDLRPSQISAARIDEYLDVKLRERDEIIAANRRGRPLYETVASASGPRRLRRRPLSNGSINRQVDVLARVLKDAQKHGWIGLNPAAEPERRLIVQRPARTFLEPEQVAALLEAAAALERSHRGLNWAQVERIRSSDRPASALARELGVSDVLIGKVRRREIWRDRPHRSRNDVPRHAPLAVLVLAGLRIDELCRLEGRHIDLARRRIVITRDITKTNAGVRTVEMSPTLHAALLDHRERRPYDADDPVFGTRNGRPINADNVRSRILAPAVARANEMLLERGLSPMGRVTPHTLRRTFVSLALIASGNDIRWVMAQVGHADHKMTYSVYAQLQRNLPREYGSKVDEIIGGSLWHQAAEHRRDQLLIDGI
jgi:integrase